MSAAREFEAIFAALRAVPPTGRAATDEALLVDAEALEALGRLVDARRVAVAAEVAWRSRPQLGGEGLAFRLGERTGSDLLARRLRIPTREANRRIAIGGPLA